MSQNGQTHFKNLVAKAAKFFKVAAADMRYLARSEFSSSLVHEKNFSFM